MTERRILKGIKKYFVIQEFVGRRTYEKYGESAWKFIDFRLLETILILRMHLGKPITANTWHKGGKFKERGLRTNLQYIFRGYFKRWRLYLSAHIFGKALDFDVQGMTVEEVHEWIIDHAHLFPYKIRLETGVNWNHLDVIWEAKNLKIYQFKP